MTGILTQKWGSQRLAAFHTISEARLEASRVSQPVWETLWVTGWYKAESCTFTVHEPPPFPFVQILSVQIQKMKSAALF